MLAGGTSVERVVEGGCPRDVVALTSVSRFKNSFASMRRQSGEQAKCALGLLAHATS